MNHRMAGYFLFCCFRSSVSFSFRLLLGSSSGLSELNLQEAAPAPAPVPQLPWWQFAFVLLRKGLMQGRGSGGEAHSAHISFPVVCFCLNPFPRHLSNSNFLVKGSSWYTAFLFLYNVSFKENNTNHISQSLREGCRARQDDSSI